VPVSCLTILEYYQNTLLFRLLCVDAQNDPADRDAIKISSSLESQYLAGVALRAAGLL